MQVRARRSIKRVGLVAGIAQKSAEPDNGAKQLKCAFGGPIVTYTFFRIHDGSNTGVLISGGSRGRVELCEIYRNELNNVFAHGRLTEPLIANCRVFEGKLSGVLFASGARGQLSECEVHNNMWHGVELRGPQTSPKVENCRCALLSFFLSRGPRRAPTAPFHDKFQGSRPI